MNAERASLEILLKQIMHFAKCYEDKFQAIYISITLLAWSGDMSQAIDMITSTLRNLKEGIPKLITPSLVQEHMTTTKMKLAELSDDELLSYPIMLDPSKMKAMRMLDKLFECLVLAGQTTSLPFVPSKMIQITLANGFSSISPVAYALYSSYLALVEGEFEGGQRYAKIALSLMRSSPSRAYDAATMFYSTNTKIYIEPMQSTCELYREAHCSALKSGDAKWANTCAFYYSNYGFWSSKEMNAAIDTMKETIKLMKCHNNLTLLAVILPCFHVACKMAGVSGVEEQSDIAFGGNSTEEDFTSKELPQQILMKSFFGFYEALIFRDFDQAKQFAEAFYATESESTVTMAAPLFMRTL